MTLKSILKQVNKYINAPEIKDEEATKYINWAMEEWHRFCPLCHKKMKNYMGVRVHLGKSHPVEMEKARRYVYLQGLN